MFGMLRPAASRLEATEHQGYASIYCNLCGTLHAEYGVASRMLVVHDIATLTWLLSPQIVAHLPLSRGNCVRGGVRAAKNQGLHPCLRYLAAISAFALGVKLRDDEQDDRTWRSSMANAIYRRTFTEATATLREVGADLQGLQSTLEEQSQLEQQAESRMDLASAPTGRAYAIVAREIARLGESPLSLPEVDRVGDALGRAIYAIDAVLDFKNDHGRSYNPLCVQLPSPTKNIPQSIRTEACNYIEQLLVTASDVFRRLDKNTHRRWNAVADQLIGRVRALPSAVAVHANCFIPCEHGVLQVNSKECSLYPCYCVCCSCVLMKLCIG